jgi:3-deoxy-D-arabino-heptulosonate 7-phosphate (DAHP) synthase class II
LTWQELQCCKAKAVRFTRDVLEDPDQANEIGDETLEDYAERRHIKLANPKGAKCMPTLTRRELLEKIEELEQQNEELQGQLDEIADIVAPEEEEEEQEEGE